MSTKHKNRGRKPGGYFDTICNYINKIGVNEYFTSAEARKATNIGSERLCYILIFLKRANVLERVGRGHYRVLAEIPDFVTYNMLEANSGYMKYYCDKNGNFRSSERGPKWMAGDPNPYESSNPNDEVLENFIDEAVKGAVPTLSEIEANLREPLPTEKFENIPGIMDNPGMKILKNSTYGFGLSMAPAGEGKSLIPSYLEPDKDPLWAVVDFKFKPGDKVYYIEFNKVCSSNVRKIEMLWKAIKTEITYTTSHGQYPLSRLFASKEDLILSLLED